MVSRVSLFDKVSTPMPDLWDSEDVVGSSRYYAMVDNNTAFTLRWIFKGWDRPPDPDDPSLQPWPLPYDAQIIRINWHGILCTYDIVATIPNFTNFSGAPFALVDYNPLMINHVRSTSGGDYVAIVILMRHWLTWDSEVWPVPWPRYAIKVILLGVNYLHGDPFEDDPANNIMLDRLFPGDDNTLNLSCINFGKPSVFHGTLCVPVNIRENSEPPPGTIFPGEPVGPTGNNYCPAPTLIITNSSAEWAADVEVECAGWNGDGDKEYVADLFYALGASAMNPEAGYFYYLAERMDWETILLSVILFGSSGTMTIEERSYPVVSLYNGKTEAYAINQGNGEVFVCTSPGTVLTTVPTAYCTVNNHVFDDKNQIVWTATEGGIVGKSLVSPSLDRTITVDWPIDSVTKLPILFKKSGNRELSMRILAGEIILFIHSGPWNSSGQNDVLVLKENLPIGWSQEWPEEP